MFPGIRPGARVFLWYTTLMSIHALSLSARGAGQAENALGVSSVDLSTTVSLRQSSPAGKISSLPASLLIDSRRNASSSLVPVASSAQGDGFTFVLSQGSDLNGSASVLIQKVDLSSRLVLWSAEYFNLGTPLGICIANRAEDSEAESLFFGKRNSILQ